MTNCNGNAATENYLMDLEDGDESSLQIIRLGLLGVVDLNGMLPALQVQHRRLVEILRKQIHIHGRGHHDDLRGTDKAKKRKETQNMSEFRTLRVHLPSGEPCLVLCACAERS